MKLLFASDISFNYFDAFPGRERASLAMRELAPYFASADFSMLNLENIVGDPDKYEKLVKSGPNLISSPDFLDYVDVLSPTAVGLANNHARDYGDAALLDTIARLKKKGYLTVGAGENIDAAYRPLVFEKDGERVSILAVAENEPGYAEDDHAGTAGYDLTRVTHMIRDARGSGSLPIVYFHGGNEFNPFPSPGKVALYRHLVELGAAAVIAMHTHCPQGHERYLGAPIIYSMGNFFFPNKTEKAPTWYYGYMTALTVKDGAVDYSTVPYTFDFDRITPLRGKALADFHAYLDYLCRPIADRVEIARRFETWCAHRGLNDLLPLLVYEERMATDGPRAVCRFKNLLNCEAHAELLAATAKLLYDGRVEEARRGIPELLSLMRMQIPEA